MTLGNATTTRSGGGELAPRGAPASDVRMPTADSHGPPAGQPVVMGRLGSWRVLRDGRFRLYFAGSLISNLGTWLQNTAQLLLAYKITHSVFAVGLVTCAQFSGFLIIGPWAGNLANIIGSKRVLIGTQLVSFAVAATMAIVILTARITEWELMAGALGTGLALTFALPVQNAMVSALVPEEDTKPALTMNSVSYNGGRTLAPVLYLVVLLSIGAGWAFALNAITFLVFSIVIFFVFPKKMTDQTKPERAWSGVHIAIRRPRILLLLAMVGAVTLADDPVLVLGPSVAHQMRATSFLPAFLLSALGLGTVLGALLPVRPTSARRTAIPLAGLAISVIVFAVGTEVWVCVLAAAAAGVAGLLTGASAQALLLEQAGPRQATQVMALWAVAWAGTKPIASVTDGWLASHLGVPWTAVILVTPALIVAILELLPEKRYKRALKAFMREYNRARPQSSRRRSLTAGRLVLAPEVRAAAQSHAMQQTRLQIIYSLRSALRHPRRSAT